MISEKAYREFNLKGKGRRIPGGQDNSYLFGDVFVKKNDGDNVNIELICNILSNVRSDKYRVPKPIRSNNGTYISDGYIASEFVEGRHDLGNIERTLELSVVFNKDIKKYDISLMKEENTQWAIGMDIIFRNREIPDYVKHDNLKLCLDMMQKLEPVNDPLQIIHADMGGNILYSKGQLPCIIDFSPCIAPALMAEAIIIVDHIAWEEENHSKFDLLQTPSIYIKYAVMFRLLSALCKKGDDGRLFESELKAYRGVWDLSMIL
ncbi:MAG TPA: hypothetical protein PLH18_10090 [Clostridia bacterium]|nr:hypothetical protein [Clostridia bacterium]HRX41548.1 hypothetical protein [Clostridia bacterium]